MNCRCIGANRRCIGANRRCIGANRRCIVANRRCIVANRRCIIEKSGDDGNDFGRVSPDCDGKWENRVGDGARQEANNIVRSRYAKVCGVAGTSASGQRPVRIIYSADQGTPVESQRCSQADLGRHGDTRRPIVQIRTNSLPAHESPVRRPAQIEGGTAGTATASTVCAGARRDSRRTVRFTFGKSARSFSSPSGIRGAQRTRATRLW